MDICNVELFQCSATICADKSMISGDQKCLGLIMFCGKYFIESTYGEAAHGKSGGPKHSCLVLDILKAELHAVPGPDVLHDGAVVTGHTLLSADATRGRHHLVLGAGVQLFVEHPHLPGLSHFLCHEPTASQLGLGLVPCPGHTVLTIARVIQPDVSNHLGLDGRHHLLSEDVGQHPAHDQDDKEEEGEDNVGEQQTLDLLVSS